MTDKLKKLGEPMKALYVELSAVSLRDANERIRKLDEYALELEKERDRMKQTLAAILQAIPCSPKVLLQILKDAGVGGG